MKRTYLLASLFSMTLLAPACGGGAGQGGPDAGGASGSAGAAGHAGTGGTNGGAGGGGTGGSAGSGGPAGSGGSSGGQPASLEDVVRDAPIIGFNAPRPDADVTVKWEPPAAAAVAAGGQVVVFHFVVRDLRGGLDVTSRALCVPAP